MANNNVVSDINKERLQNVNAQASLGVDQENREELVNSRRARQSKGGNGNKNTRFITAAVLIGTSVILFAIFVGPQKVFSSMFGSKIETQRTSNVDLKVGQRRDDQVNLDFSVPAKPVPEVKQVDPNAEWNEKLKALQAELEAVQKNNQPSVSSSEIQRMMSKYNEDITRKFDDQRAQLLEENKRLREEASMSAEARKRAEEASKAAAQEQKEREALEKTKRESNAVVVDQGSPNGATFASDGTGESATSGDISRDMQFLQTAASTSYTTAASRRLPDTSRTVVQGTIISAVLETAIDTQLPGSLRAQIIEPVFSFDGTRILMPQGTIMVGQFNNEVNLEQKRVQITWNRAITPNGKSIDLGSIGTDKLGRSGTLGNVDNRYGKKFGAAVLISSIAAIPAAVSNQTERRRVPSENSTTINVGSGSGGGGSNDIGSTVSKSLGDQASGALEQYMKLPPIIRVPQGEEVRIFVNRDLVFR